jgi:hypothetical protein
MANGTAYAFPEYLTPEQRTEMYGLPAQLLYDIVSGNLARQGYSVNRNLLNSLVGLGPNLGQILSDAGYSGYDPTWVTQYIKPGKLGADEWANMMDYARSFHNTTWEDQALPMMDQYQMAGYTDPWKMWVLEGQQRANELIRGQQFNPFTGQYEPVPQLAQQGTWATLQSFLENLTNLFEKYLGGGTTDSGGGTGGGNE